MEPMLPEVWWLHCSRAWLFWPRHYAGRTPDQSVRPVLSALHCHGTAFRSAGISQKTMSSTTIELA